MATIQIAIDGPAGAGKSTISKTVAKQLGYIYIDTGAMYRTVGLAALRCGKNPKIAAEVESILNAFHIEIRHDEGEQHIYLDGENVSAEIRRPEVSVAASDVAVIPAVRLKLVELQRQLAAKENVIMDGRDIGTYVLPDAKVKIFLTASLEERARRRYEELQQKGDSSTLQEVQTDMAYRDKNDSGREFAPLKPAQDSIIVDTTGNTLEQSVEQILHLIREKINYESV